MMGRHNAKAPVQITTTNYSIKRDLSSFNTKWLDIKGLQNIALGYVTSR